MKQFKGISGSTLKLIAIVTMLIDHIGAAGLEYFLKYSALLSENMELKQQVYQINYILRSIGRLSLPIFCFLLVEGFVHTRNVRKYTLRLLIFALVSEIPFDLAFFNSFFDVAHQNIYFTLLIGLLVLIGIDRLKNKTLLQTLICLGGFCLAELLNTDYGFKGVFLIAVLYFLRHNRAEQALSGAVLISWQRIAAFSFIPIYGYNGKRGLPLKYLFYWFYPVHLLILTGLARLFMP